jgi:hypothetical protein
MAEELLEADPIETDEPVEETPAEGADLTEQPAEGEQPAEITSLFDADGKRVAQPIRDQLAKMKAENPAAAKLIADAVYRTAEFRREFPGGLAEMRELRDQVEQFGGLAALEEKAKDAQEFAELGQAFTEEPQLLVQDMVVSDPEAFSRFAPIAFDRYREENVKGWNAYVAKVFDADIRSGPVPLALSLLMRSVKDNPEAIEQLNIVNGYLGKFQAIAAEAPEVKPPQRRTAQPNESKRENDLRAREWNTERRELHTEIKTEAMTKALAGRKPTTEEKAQIEELFMSRANRLASNNFKGWQEKAQAYIARNDKAGYLRYMGSIYRRVVPEALTSAIAGTLKGRGAVAVAQPGVARKPNVAPNAAAKPADGFALVAKEPDSYLVDYSRTTSKMVAENKAVLSDGKKVYWR